MDAVLFIFQILLLAGMIALGVLVRKYLPSYAKQKGKDHRLIEADASHVRFRYRDHHDGKEKTMTLKTPQFMNRVLWHVPVKGQHNVRYYGLYVPGARAKRDSIRAQMDEAQGEVVKPGEKQDRICLDCGAVLFHYRSTRRQISYIKEYLPARKVRVCPTRRSSGPLQGWVVTA